MILQIFLEEVLLTFWMSDDTVKTNKQGNGNFICYNKCSPSSKAMHFQANSLSNHYIAGKVSHMASLFENNPGTVNA